MSFTAPIGANTLTFVIENPVGTISFTGDGTSGLFLWGAQLEAGAYATSYIPTTTTSVTRNADTFNVSDIYTSGKITSAGGTWFVDLRNNIDYTADTIIGAIFLDTTPAGYVEGFMFRKFASGRLIIRKLIASTATTLYTTTSNTPKVAIKWNGTTADVFENGSKVVSASAFTPTAMQFLANTNNPLYANINSMALYPTPLLDYQCEMLTGLKFDTYNEMAGYYNYTIQ
jgi:hypothetical protein